MSSTLSVATLLNLVRKVAEPTLKMLRMFLTLSNIDVLAFGSPVPEEWSQFPLYPANHFDIFVKALAIFMTYGTELSSDMSAIWRGLLEETRAVQGCLEEYTDHHAARLDPHNVYVEKSIVDAINADLKDFLGVLGDDAEALRQRHAFLAPASGSGQPAKTPRFDQLYCLVDRNHTHSLIRWLDNGLVTPKQKAVGQTGATRRKPVDYGDTAARARPRNHVAGAASSPFAFFPCM